MACTPSSKRRPQRKGTDGSPVRSPVHSVSLAGAVGGSIPPSGETLKSLLFPFGLAMTLLAPALSAQRTAATMAELPDAPVPQIASQTAGQTGSPVGTHTIPPAQTSGSAPGGSAAGETPQGSDQALKSAEKQRMLGVMPAFNVVEEGYAPPLKPRSKFELWYKSAIDPFTFAVAGLGAGIEQAENSYPEYHQGFEGFAKRYGAGYADSVDGGFWGNAVLPVLFKQDPRYFRMAHGPKKRRLVYALFSTVRSKGDNGKWQPAYANVLGNLISGGIANVYYPASSRGAGLTFERGFTVTAEGALGAIAYEFYPDTIVYLKRRHNRNHPPATSAPATAAPQR